MRAHQLLDAEAPFDWREAGELLGASTKQILFAMAKAKGANNARAAKAAGYSGTDEQLAKVGYRVIRGDKVQALLKWAETEGEGISGVACSSDELKQILSRHARGEDQGASIRAAEALHRLNQHEGELEDEDEGNPRATLDKIAEISPTYAILLADHHQVNWAPDGLAELVRCAHCGQLIPAETRTADEAAFTRVTFQ